MATIARRTERKYDPTRVGAAALEEVKTTTTADTDVPLRGTATAARSHPAPLVVPASRVNVALPFSKITIEEPAKEFTEMAAIVAVAATSLLRADQGP